MLTAPSMKIHSSSLTFTPIGFNHKSRPDSSNNRQDSALPNQNTAQEKKVNTPEEIKKTLAALNQDTNTPSTDTSNLKYDVKALRALSTYSHVSNSPQLDQRSQLLSGIDTYA